MSSRHRVCQLAFFFLAIVASIIAITNTRNDDTSCGYAMDGIDDFASFSVGTRDAEKLHNDGFTMMFWLRNKRKDKNGHFEQCLMSHSIDEYGSSPILKMQLTVESKLSITLRFGDTRKVTCDVDMALQDERWYHASMSVHPENPMEVFVNGVKIKYYCVENKGEPLESFNTEHVFSHVPFLSSQPMILGSNMPQEHGENFYKGNIADFKLLRGPLGASDTFHLLTSYPFEYSAKALSASRQLLVDLPLRVNCSSAEPLGHPYMVGSGAGGKYRVFSPGSSSMGNSYTSSMRNVLSTPDLGQHLVPPVREHEDVDTSGSGSSPGGLNLPHIRTHSFSLPVTPSAEDFLRQQRKMVMFHLSGGAVVEGLNLGDGQLSVMLTVAETKLAFMQHLRDEVVQGGAVRHHDFSSTLGEISSFVVNGERGLDQLCSSLARHFDVQMDENRIWRGYNEYAIRLEMLGHSISLILKQQGVEKSRQKLVADRVKRGMACRKSGENCQFPTAGLNASITTATAPDTTPVSADPGGGGGDEVNNKSTHANTSTPPPPAPVVALIVPATSKGISARKLNHLSLSASLLPSLYQTRSKGYNYHIYLTVNEHDPIYSDPTLTHTIFDVAYSVAKEKYFFSLNETELSIASQLNPEAAFPRIPHRVILVPDSMLPKRGLSALFNIPTLIAAHTDNCDFFYVVNDDLLLKSYHWTEKLVEPLVNNPVYPGLGVSGGIDVSDSITPQIEFPFFSRTHVDLFPWCGCNPWVFKNWWEDNWLTDIYLPFDSIFYRRDVVVENYIGLEVKVAVSGSGKSGSADPSYTVTEGRRTPFFYTEEVEKARKRIVNMLEGYVSDAKTEGQEVDEKDNLKPQLSHTAAARVLEEELPHVLAFVQGFDDLLLFQEGSQAEAPSRTEVHSMSVVHPETLTALRTNLGYCDGVHDRPPSLLTMPVAAHEYILDPCDSQLHASEHRRFVPEVHSTELPHTAYAGLLLGDEAAVLNAKWQRHNSEGDVERENNQLTSFEREKQESVAVCRHYYLTLEHFRRKSQDPVHRVEDLDDDVFQDWEACVHGVGFDKFFALKALQKNELCSSNSLSLSSSLAQPPPYDSCDTNKHPRLKILILHNHAPLFTRYGSDKRLYHIAETLVGLGHEVVFGGSFVSGLETPDDHLRLRHIDAKLYSPLAIDSGDRSGIYGDEFAVDSMLKKEQPDVVLMTLWFWNTPPTTALFMDMVRRLMPNVRIGVVSDDAHTLREELLLTKENEAGQSMKGTVMSLLGGSGLSKGEHEQSRDSHDKTIKSAQAFRTFKQIRTLEYLAYAKADVVLTITDNDREKILSTKREITNLTVPQIDRGRYSRGPEPERDRDYPLLLQPLPADKIKLVRYALSPTEIVSNFGLKLRRGESGGTIEGEKRAHLSFVGNGANPTNIEAMRWFASDIFELIRKELPGVQLILIGADWEFMRTEFPHFFDAQNGDAIVIRGILSQEDLTSAIVTTKVFVSPISVSTGLNTKNLLALSRGLPLVTTPLGAEGLMYAARDGESGPHTLNPDAPFALATTAESFANKTVRLYKDNVLWRQVALSALRHARTSFGLSVQAHELEDALHYAFSQGQRDSNTSGEW